MSDAPPQNPVTFTRKGFGDGLRLILPMLPSFAPFGLVVGILSAGEGLSLLEAGLMSAMVFAGTSQLVALGGWGSPVPVLAVSLAVLVVNLRMAPMSAALAPWFHGLRGWRLWASLFTVTDHSFALSVNEMRRGRRDAALLLGMGVPTWMWWVCMVCLGHGLSAVLHLRPGHPLLFAGLATLCALTVSLWRGRGDVVPWGVAGAAALTVQAMGLGAPWPVLAGAMLGSAAGAFRDRAAGAGRDKALGTVGNGASRAERNSAPGAERNSTPGAERNSTPGAERNSTPGAERNSTPGDKRDSHP